MTKKSELQMYQGLKFKHDKYDFADRKWFLEKDRPFKTPFEAVSHCIDRLEDWPDIYDELTTEFCPSLTYQEVLGALLLARDVIEEQQDNDEWSGYPNVKKYLENQKREDEKESQYEK